VSRFFIDRPIFAWVLAIIMILAGILAIRSLPIAQYPDIAPPAISITTLFPGADAQTLENTTTQVIEQQMKGLDHLEYFSSTSDSAGNLTITLTFAQGANPDIAQVQVQNKLQQATPLLPPEVQQQGLVVAKATKNFLMVVSIYSADGSHNQIDLGDYVAAKLQDPLSRLTGVGDSQVLGAQYAMRIWVDPYKLTDYALTMGDVVAAIQAQNAQVSAGQVGGLPTVPGQALNATITAQTRLQTADQFRQILLRTNPDGSNVRMSDVARIEMGSENYSFLARYNGKQASGIAIKLAPGANALDTVKAVKAKVQELSKQFPSDIRVAYPLDSSAFVELSVEQVVHTLIEAVVLVFIVMFLFLQNWRATIIPTITVPVVLMGSFAALKAVGFTINTLTLFGMVLAIGLLVDDAIVVVENVERLIQDEKLSPKAAARKSMDEISGALVGIGMVLSAVFLPMAFFGGSTGVIYRQFSITIVSSMALSVLTALILTPALCATILKPANEEPHHSKGFLGWFNRTFDRTRDQYAKGVQRVERRWGRTLAVYGLIVVGMAVIFLRLPGGFLPAEDQGIMFAQVTLPVGSSMEETQRTLDKVSDYFLKEEKHDVEAVFSIAGFGFVGQGQNVGLAFIRAKPFEERKGAAHRVPAIIDRANVALAKLRAGSAVAFSPPPVLELGNADGFDFELKDNANRGHGALIAARDQLLGLAAADKRLALVRSNGLDDLPQLKLNVDEPRAGALGLSLADVNTTISTAFGGAYINSFIDRGRVKKVFVQADAPFRTTPDSIGKLYVRGATGAMTPFSAFSSTQWTYGPAKLERYNGVPAVELLGMPAPGQSSGDAMAAMDQLAGRLPAGVGHEWTGLSFEQQFSGGQAPMLYVLSLLIVFLCLAALYESWSVPIAVLLVVPLGVIGAVTAAALAKLNNDIFLQVGLITTVGVSAKNAILIVEFAEEKMREGLSAGEAALEAAKLRLRPILMTSFAFVFGVLPLALSTGAGAGGQNAIGWSVVGGMLSATLLAIFFVPTFFRIVKQLFRQDQPREAPEPPRVATPASQPPEG